MNQSMTRHVASDPKVIKIVELGLLMFVVVALCLKFRLLLQTGINQDEFRYLSDVYTHERGTLADQFHTFHVHFFCWLSYFSNNEVTQIIVARSVMYLFFLGTNILTYLIGRRFINRSGALFAVLCFLAFSFVVINGAAFRSDTISSFLCLLSIYMIIAGSPWLISAVIAGVAMGLALMITTKSVFHLLSLGVVFLWLLFTVPGKRDALKRVICFVVALVIGFLSFYYIHVSTLHTPHVHPPHKFVSSTSSKVIIFRELFPGLRFLEISLYQNLVIWTVLIAGIVLLGWRTIRATKTRTTGTTILLLGLLVPLVSLGFYRNSFPYFYVFILTPAIIVCGVVIHEIIEVLRRTGSVLSVVLVGVLAVFVFHNCLFYYLLLSPRTKVVQKELLKAVHDIFPEPVPYIDGCSMAASYPSAGFFMSSWGMEGYLEAKKPVMRNILERRQPLFLLSNVPELDLALSRSDAVSTRGYSLLDQDWTVLQSHFIHHWGRVYVLGQEFEFSPTTDSRNFQILVPGAYTLEGETAVLIDGDSYAPGDVIDLNKGRHTIALLQNPGKVVLRWGRHLYKPDIRPSPGPLFLGPFV